MSRILVVDDDLSLLRTLRISLAARGYEVLTAPTGTEGLRLASESVPDVVVLDLGLPDLDGTDVIGGLREHTTLPIIVLSARTESTDKVDALDLGADDYVTKPFGVDELLARIRAAIRRAATAPDESDPIIRTSAFTIDLTAKKVSSHGTEIRLTPTEWSVLEMLVRHRGKLVGKHQLLQQVWGSSYHTETHYLRLYIAQLRRKLEPDTAQPRYLITEPGRGYRFELADNDHPDHHGKH